MAEYRERNYRKKVQARGLVSFHVAVKETDLWVSSEKKLIKETEDLILTCRHQLETYIQTHPEFLTTLRPYPDDAYAPPVVKEMIASTRDIGVGPMASVAGAVAQFVCRGLLNIAEQVIVENGGDIFLQADRALTVSIFAGDSPLSEKIGLRIPPEQMPLGICSSSGRVGHSLSMGSADVVCLLSPSAARADGAATSIGNRIRTKADLERAAEWARSIDGILGGVAIMGDRMASWGDIELVTV